MDGNSCFQNWIALQQASLDELQHSDPHDEAQLRTLVTSNLRLYEDYAAKRRDLCPSNITTFFAPSWCAAFENSLMWFGGCRPTLFIRLLYTLSGTDLEANLHFIRHGTSTNSSERGGSDTPGGVRLTEPQMERVNELHWRTVAKEGKLSRQMAILQEDLGDKPVVMMLKQTKKQEVGAVIDGFEAKLAALMGEADKLRIATLTKLVLEILMPVQAVKVLMAAKQLHLSLHEWGQNRDRLRKKG